MSENNKYRKLLDSIADVIEFDGVLGVSHLYEALPRLVRERLAEKRLPEPDATNPEHCKWAAQLLEAIVEDVPESEYEQVREVDNTADRLRWRADRLDAARSAEREREQRIEEAAEIVCDASAVLSGEATWNKAPDWWKDTFREAARALDAAGLLRGGGRGE